MDEREPKILRAFTSMEVTPAGGLEQCSIKGGNLSQLFKEYLPHVRVLAQVGFPASRSANPFKKRRTSRA